LAPVAHLESHQPGEVVATGEVGWSFSGLDSKGQEQTGQFTGKAWAQADYGVLKAYTTATLINPMVNLANPIYTNGWSTNPEGTPTLFSASSEAYFSDSISGLGNVSSIRIMLSTTAQLGAYSIFSLMQTTGASRWDYVNSDPVVLSGWLEGGVDASVLSYAIPVVNGVASFGFVLGAWVDFYPGDPSNSAMEGGIFTGTADASHTVKLDMVYGYDASGQQVSLAGAVSDSGTVYEYAPALAVPEPTSWMLLCAGLMSGALVRRRLGRERS